MSNQKLPITSLPKTGESLLGYILRLAQLNHHKSIRRILKFVGLFNNDVKTLLNTNYAGFIELSKLTGINKEHLQEMAFIPIEDGKYVNFSKQRIPYSYVRAKYAKVCPDCLKESGFYRKEWELGFITACLKHRCFLIDKCPNCGEKISWKRPSLSRCRCGFDFLSINPNKIEEIEMLFIKAVNSLLSSSFGDISIDLMNIETYVRTCLLLSSHSDEGKAFLRQTPWGIPVSDLHHVLNTGARIIEDWPSNFYKLLDLMRSKNIIEDKSGLNLEFGNLYRDLFITKIDTEYNFVRQAFQIYIQKWDGGCRSYHTKIQFQDNYVSRRVAKKMLGCSQRTIEIALKSGSLNAVIKTKANRRIILIDRKSIEKLLEHRKVFDKNDTIDLKTLSKQLGVHHETLAKVASSGLIDVINDPKNKSLGCWLFPSNTYESIISKLKNNAKFNKEMVDTITFTVAATKLRAIGISKAQFIKMLLKGKIRAECILKGKTGLDILGFIYANLVEEVLGLSDKGLYSTLETSEKLFVKPMDIKLWTDKLYIKSSGSIGKTKLYSHEEILKFEKKYILAKNMAKANKLTSKKLIGIIFAEGIAPISGRKIDGGKYCLYLREDIIKNKKLKLLLNDA